MAICVFKLTKRSRVSIAIGLYLLITIQILIGIILMGYGIYVTKTIGPQIYSERAEINFVFVVISMYGLQICIQYVSGIHIVNKCLTKANKKSTGKHLLVWTLYCYNTFFNGMILTTFATKIAKHIIRSIRFALQRGITKYLSEPRWKYAIDRLQQRAQCCGSAGYNDWLESTWITADHMQANYTFDLQEKKVLTLPWSCCKINFALPCFHDPRQQIMSKDVWSSQPKIVLESIYNDGCLGVLRKPIENGFILFILANVSLILLQIIITVVLRVMFTSAQNAVRLGNPNGKAPGWVLGRGDCGFNIGPTLSKIILNRHRRSHEELTDLVESDEESVSTDTSKADSDKSHGKSPLDRMKIYRDKLRKKLNKSPDQTDVSETNDTDYSEKEALMMG